MKLTINYYHYFGPGFRPTHMFSPAAWDELRAGAGGEDYAIPPNRLDWVRGCVSYLPARVSAEAAIGVAERLGATALFSVGVGRAFVEYNIKQLRPSLRMTCTEYASRTVESLRTLFTECEEITVFDLTSPKWPGASDSTLYLLYRVDTGFTDDEWSKIFKNMSDSGVKHVLLVATEFLTLKRWAKELVRRTWHRLSGRSLTFAGYLRSKDTFRQLGAPDFVVSAEIPFGELTGFLLSRSSSPLWNDHKVASLK